MEVNVVVRGAWAARVGGLPPAYWRIWTGTLINRLGTFVEPFLALYLTVARGISVAETGVVIAVYGAGNVLAPPLGGYLADRVGRRTTLAASMVGSAVLLALLAFAHALWLIVADVLVLGIVGDVYRPAAQAAVADLVGLADRRRASGLIFWAVNLGFSAAAVVGGLLASAGYELLFLIDAATCLTYGLIVLRTVPETRPAAAVNNRGGRFGGFGVVARDRVVVALLALNLVNAVAFLQLFTILPLAMDHDGLGPATYGLVAAVNGLVIVVLHPALSPVLLRRDPGHVLAVASALAALGCLGLARADHPLGYVVAVAVFTLGELSANAVGPGLIGELAPAEVRGRYAGAWGLSFGVGALVGPLLGTQLLGEGDAAAPWLAAAGLSGLAVIGQLALSPALRRRRVAAGVQLPARH